MTKPGKDRVEIHTGLKQVAGARVQHDSWRPCRVR